MINLIKKDIRLAFISISTLLFLILYIPFIMFVDLASMRMTYLASVLTFTYMSLSVPFQYELKNKTHILIQSLPLKKRDIVISRYIYSIIGFVFSLIFTYICFKIISILGFDVGNVFSIDTFKQSIFVVTLAMSIVLPVHFVFDPKVANFLGIFIYILFFNFLSIINYSIEKLNLLENNNLLMLALVVFMFLLSLSLSIYIYSKRSFS